ncbi:MAG: radical SAM protein, partial [Candidatus Sumerlaeia bacterium]|nr:radical SAM protein [Candidatus Sumerlaeia bacterium]
HRTPSATAAELPFPSRGPDRSGLDLAFYDREGGMGNIQTKRGCPCRCLYCTYPLLEGRRFQTRPAEAVADEAAALLSHGVQYLYVVDNYFNAPADHAEAVCRALIARRLNVPWSCFAHPAFLDDRLATLMKQAGCASVELGSDAGSAAMLESLRKDMMPEQILAASNACQNAGLPFAHYLLLGGPGETEATLAETFDLMDRCNPTAVIVMCGIRIYPGTPLERCARDEGLLAENEPLLEPKFYISPAVRRTLLDRVTDAASRRPNWIVPGLGINLSPRLTRKLRDLGHKGPMWELLERRKRGKP